MFKKIRDAFTMATFLYAFTMGIFGLVRLAIDLVQELAFQIARRFHPSLTRSEYYKN